MKMKIRNIFFGFSIVVMLLTIVIIIPIIINEAYKTGEGYYTVWNGADVLAFYGSIMSFIGTAFISIIALYQNKKFKEENDKTQKRIEEISIRANELNSINIIIEYELKQINLLETLLNSLEETTNIQHVAIELNKESKPLLAVAAAENKVDKLMMLISTEINRNIPYCKKSKKLLGKAQLELFSNFKDFINDCRSKNPMKEHSKEYIANYQKQWYEFVLMKDSYLNDRRELIEKSLYEDLTLAEVKKLFSKSAEEEQDNG